MQPKYITALLLVLSTSVYTADESNQESSRKCAIAQSMYKTCLMVNGKFWPYAVYKHAPQPMCAVQYFAMIEKCREVHDKMKNEE